MKNLSINIEKDKIQTHDDKAMFLHFILKMLENQNPDPELLDKLSEQLFAKLNLNLDSNNLPDYIS